MIDKVDQVIFKLDGIDKTKWKEGSESTAEKPTWIRIGKFGVVGRVSNVTEDGKWYYAYYNHLNQIAGGASTDSLEEGMIEVERGLSK